MKTYRDWFGADLQARPGMSLRQFYGEPARGEIEPQLKCALGGEEVSYERTVEHRGVRREVRSDQRRLQRQAAVLRWVTEAIPAIVAVVGADRRYRFVNGAYERWCGAPRASIVGRTLVDVLGRRDAERSEPWIARVLAGESVNFERHYADRREASHRALSYIPLWLDDGSVDGFVGVGQDISHHREQEGRLLELAHRDVLAGLLNRAGFETFLERCLERGEGAELALLYIDLEHFKPVDDQHGHPVGDMLVKQFANRLRNADTMLYRAKPGDRGQHAGGALH